MEYRRTENPAIPAEIMLGKYSTPVWIQSAWTEGEFAQYIRNNGCGHCCIAMAARLRGIDMDPYREYLLCRSLWGPPDAEKGQDHFLTVPGIEKILRHLGLSASCFGVAEGAQNQAADHIIRCLQEGKLVIFISDPFRYPGNMFSTGYHYVLAVGIRADGKILIANSSENTTKGGVQWVTREQIAQSLYQGGEPNKSLTWGEIERFGQGCTYVVIDETEWTVSK